MLVSYRGYVEPNESSGYEVTTLVIGLALGAAHPKSEKKQYFIYSFSKSRSVHSVNQCKPYVCSYTLYGLVVQCPLRKTGRFHLTIATPRLVSSSVSYAIILNGEDYHPRMGPAGEEGMGCASGIVMAAYVWCVSDIFSDGQVEIKVRFNSMGAVLVMVVL